MSHDKIETSKKDNAYLKEMHEKIYTYCDTNSLIEEANKAALIDMDEEYKEILEMGPPNISD